MTLHVETPLVQSLGLSRALGKHVWLKLDALQPSGSFKIRGIGLACETYRQQGKKKFIASSGGNAGLAVAYAGRKLGVPVTVVIPRSTPAHARTLLELEGATVVVHGAAWSEAHSHALCLLDDESALIHPFDDPLLWEGHSSVIDEVIAAGCNFDCVIVAVGGGGLMSGVIEGLNRHRRRTPVIAVETDGADCLSNALARGENVGIPRISSIARSLGANRVAQHAFDLARTNDVRSVVVTDAEALQSCSRFLDDQRILVEPACGAALALLYREDQETLASFDSPLVIVCGGATATYDDILKWQAAAESSRA